MEGWRLSFVRLFSVVLLFCRGESQVCPQGNFSYLMLDQTQLLGLADISAMRQEMSLAFENSSQFRELAEVNGSSIIAEIAGKLAASLLEVAMAAKNITAAAYPNYINNLGQHCCSDQCIRDQGAEFSRSSCSEQCPRINENATLGFYRATVPTLTGLFTREGLDYQEDPGLGRAVDLNATALHFPVDIYDRDPRVLCFSQWSDNLTQFFIENNTSAITGSAHFQYFGAASGALRFYPASDWSFLSQCRRCPRERVDNYDSRFRPWYVNTVPGTKFLIIVLDLSGSMTGFRLLLAKLTAKQLLLSLNHNDFFLVMTEGGGNEGGMALTSCFSTARRASPENILTVVEVISAISRSRNSISYRDVVNSAFKEFRSPASPASCHQLLVFLTDRDVLISDLADVLESQGTMPPSPQIVVAMMGFVRKILQESITELRRVTCKSGGFIREIPSYNDINTFLLHFFNNLHSNSAGGVVQPEVFWNHYLDVMSGIVLTCSQAVYDNDSTTPEQSAGVLVGVGGVDVNLTQLELIFQQHDLGPYGYGFVVDNNGQLLVHPLINHTYIKALSADDLLSVDVSSFEHSSMFEMVREALLNRSTGSITVEASVGVGGDRSEFRTMNVSYYYAPISGTPLSVAVVIPVSHSNTGQAKPLTREQLESLHSSFSAFSSSHNIHLLRPVCDVSELSPTFNLASFIQRLIDQQLNSGSNATDCDQSRVNSLLLDLWVVANENFTTEQSRVLELPSGLVVSTGMGGPPPFSLATRRAALDFALERNSSDNVFYSNTAEGPSWFVVLGAGGPDITSKSSFSAIYGESGISLPLTSASTSTILLILGQGRGLVLNSTLSDQRGQYFADLYPHVFNDAFMSEISSYNMSVLCGFEVRPCGDIFRSTTVCTSSAYSMYRGVMFSLVSGLWWILSGGPLLSLHFAVTSLHASIMSSAQTSCPVYLCDHQVATFQWPRPPFNKTRRSICNDSMCYSIGALSGTNLFLVEIGGGQNATCSHVTSFLDDIPRLVPVQSCPCSNASERYRVDPPSTEGIGACYNSSTTKTCNHGTSLAPARALFIVSLSSFIILGSNFLKYF